jgi:hypothetical protein
VLTLGFKKERMLAPDIASALGTEGLEQFGDLGKISMINVSCKSH